MSSITTNFGNPPRYPDRESTRSRVQVPQSRIDSMGLRINSLFASLRGENILGEVDDVVEVEVGQPKFPWNDPDHVFGLIMANHIESDTTRRIVEERQKQKDEMLRDVLPTFVGQ